MFSKPQSGNVIIHKFGPLVLAQKERGLELSEQFDEKILQVLTRVSHSALEIPPVCMGTCSSQLVCDAQNNFEASPTTRATPGNFLCPICRVATSGGFSCHFRNMCVLRDRVQLAVRTVGVVNLKLAWVGWAI